MGGLERKRLCACVRARRAYHRRGVARRRRAKTSEDEPQRPAAATPTSRHGGNLWCIITTACGCRDNAWRAPGVLVVAPIAPLLFLASPSARPSLKLFPAHTKSVVCTDQICDRPLPFRLHRGEDTRSSPPYSYPDCMPTVSAPSHDITPLARMWGVNKECDFAPISTKLCLLLPCPSPQQPHRPRRCSERCV